MTFTYDLNEGGVLIVRADEQDRENIREIISRHGTTNQAEVEALESLLANSELEWVDPAETGDLTDAPMLGIRDSDTENDPTCQGKIIARWAFMDYQVRSFLVDLIDKGQAVFTS